VKRLLVAFLAFLAVVLAVPVPAQELPLPTVSPGAQQASSVRVDRIVFRGNRAVSDADLQTVAAPYTGRVVGADELEALRQALTRLYVERGYINSGVLLPARPADGVLALEVVEGRLTGLRLRGLKGLDEAYLRARLVRPEDQVLNIEQLRERFQLLLDDPLFEHINARLEPGALAGEAELEVEVERARSWQLSAFVNNYRPASIGAEAVGLAGSLRNLSGLGDLLEFRLQASPRRSAGGNGSLTWHLPLVALGLRDTELSLAGEAGSSSVIEEPVEPLDIRSRLASGEIGIRQRLLESLSQSLDIGLGLLSRSNRTELLGEPFSFTPGVPDGRLHENLLRLWQAYTWRNQREVLALRSIFILGRNNVQAAGGLTANAPPERDFGLWDGQLHYRHQVMDNGAQLIVRVNVQLSPDHLMALDGMVIGGVNSVRGYRENQLVRDRGASLNFEFEVPWLLADGSRLTLAPFLDLGTARNKDESGTDLASLGLALGWQWQGLRLDLALAHRLLHPSVIGHEGGTLQDQGIQLQLTWNF